MLTLTYDRKQWDDARDLYEAASQDRHVRRFISRLEKYLGASLRGKWCRKMEFHDDGEGWVHWHILIDWRSSIPHEVLTHLWGHGFVWVGKATESRVRYVGKYVAKTIDDLPKWLLGERARSVKIMAVSPGFWEVEKTEDDFSFRVEDCRQRLPWYVSVGQAMSKRCESIRLERYEVYEGELMWEYHTFRLTILQVHQVLEAHGLKLSDMGDDGWFHVCENDNFQDVLSDLRGVEWAHGSTESFEPGEDALSRDSGGAASLHLTTQPNPPSWLLDFWEGIGALSWNGAPASGSMRMAA